MNTKYIIKTIIMLILFIVACIFGSKACHFVSKSIWVWSSELLIVGLTLTAFLYMAVNFFPTKIIKIKKRKQCSYPMSEFYIYEDEVPAGMRISTPEECESCDEECDVKHCLIWEK